MICPILLMMNPLRFIALTSINIFLVITGSPSFIESAAMFFIARVVHFSLPALASFYFAIETRLLYRENHHVERPRIVFLGYVEA